MTPWLRDVKRGCENIKNHQKPYKTHHWRDRDSEFSLPLITIVVEKWKGWNLHPAFAIRYRYRNAGGGAGNITIRAPCSAVGHGSMYHSQSVSNSATNMFGSKMGWPPWPFWWAKSWKMLIQHEIDGHYTPLYFRDTQVWDELTCFFSLVAILCWSCCPVRNLLPT